jgi:autoinducer 2-degrading protein
VKNRLVQAGVLIALLAAPQAFAETTGYVNVVELDIVPAQIDAFLALAKENAETTTKEPGCREFNVVVSMKDPNHVMLVEMYDDEASLQKHRGTEHFKHYQAATNPMVTKRDIRGMKPVSLERAH